MFHALWFSASACGRRCYIKHNYGTLDNIIANQVRDLWKKTTFCNLVWTLNSFYCFLKGVMICYSFWTCISLNCKGKGVNTEKGKHSSLSRTVYASLPNEQMHGYWKVFQLGLQVCLAFTRDSREINLFFRNKSKLYISK